MRKLEEMHRKAVVKLMNTAARSVEFAFQSSQVKRPAFVLLVFNDPEQARYISNCDRKSMVKALRFAADRLEGGEVKVDVPESQ